MSSIYTTVSDSAIAPQNYREDIKPLDQVMSESKTDMNIVFLMMYEEWKQNILLSNGVDEDENADW